AAVFQFADDTDDREPRVRRVRRADLDTLADRVLSGPETPDDVLTDDDAGVVRGRILVGEGASGLDRNPQRLEELRTDTVHVGARHRLRITGLVAFGGVERCRRIRAERNV